MRWVTKEADISVLIQYGKDNLSSENYLFVTTKDMLDQTKENLEVFCPQIKPNQIISGFVEKINEKLVKEINISKMRISERALVIFSIKKELIDKQRIENFTDIDEKLLPIIQIVNPFDYKDPQMVKANLDWFIDKIHGKEIEFTDHIPTNFKHTGTMQKGNMESHHGIVKFAPPFENFRPLSREIQVLVTNLDKQFVFSLEMNQIQILMLKLATQIDAENYSAIHELGNCYAKVGNWEQAKELYIKTLEINPKFSAAKIMLAESYTHLYQFSLALHEIKKIDLAKQPDVEKINIILVKAKIKLIRGDLDGANLEFQNAHNIGEKTEDNWKHLEDGLYGGWQICQTEKGDKKRTIEILEIHKRRNPDSVVVWNNLGMTYSLLGEHEKSLDALEHAYKLDSREPNVLMNLGLFYLRKKDEQTALMYYQKAKTSLEQGYEKYTESDQDGPITKQALELCQMAITIIKEGSGEDKEKFRSVFGGQIQTVEELYPLPPPPKERKLEELENTHKRCKKAIQNFIRKKYDSDPEKFRKDFASNYDEAKKRLDKDKKKMHPQKNADLFSFIDTGVFPYIIKIKQDEWELEMESLNLVSMLYSNRDMRNDDAHDMEMTPRQKEIRFQVETELIEFFERRANE